MMRRIVLTGCSLLVGSLHVAGSPGVTISQILPEGFSITNVSGPLANNVTAFALLPDERILVANQISGQVHFVVNGAIKGEPLLTVPDIHWSGEQGLLGIAVDPDFPDSNYVYLFHTRNDSLNRVSRYTINGDLLDANSDNLEIDENSQRTIIEFPDMYQFHNGGTLRFGSDKTLYVSHGDDARTNLVQDLTNPFGKILRINRDGSVPPDNPVFDPEPEGRMGEIFAMGLRNPFRFAIDPLTDELFIGDVGPEDVEELNLSRGGENFGWPRYIAGDHYLPEIPLATTDSTFPIHSYQHANRMRAVIGLLTYRQRDFPNDSSFPPEYEGVHFFADFFAGPMRYLKSNEEGEWSVVEFAQGILRPVDAALAADGGIYVLEYGRSIRKIEYTGIGVSTEPDPSIPRDRLTLTQNYPNPFDRATRFSYMLSHHALTTVSIFNVLGEHVITLRESMGQPGLHEVEWNGFDRFGVQVPPGVYLYRVDAGDMAQSRMMLVAY